MATDVADLLLRIDATTEGLRRELKKAESAVQGGTSQIEKSTRQIDKRFNDMGATVKRVAAGIAVAFVTTKLVGEINKIIDVTKNFESELSNLSAITGATGKDLDFLSEQAKEIGRTTTLSASQAVTAFKLIASAKPDLLESGEALNTVTRQAVLLAEAAKMDLASAATVVGTSLNQFGAGAEEAARFVNVLAAGAKFGASEIEQTSQALKNSGAAANAAGLSFEETNAGIQALAAGGIRAAEAGTGLRNVLLILEKQSNDQLKPSVVGLSQAMVNLANEEMSLTEITEMFGRESAIAAQTLVDQSGKMAELERNITNTSTAMEQASANNDNLQGDLKQLASATEALQISIGERLTPNLRGATQGVTDLTASIAEYIGSEQFTENMELAGDLVKALSISFAALSGVQLARFVVQMNIATAAQAAFNVVARANPYVLLGLGVTGLVVALDKYTRSQKEATQAAREYFAVVPELDDALKNMVRAKAAELEATDDATAATEAATEAAKDLTQKYSFLFRMQNRGRDTVTSTTRSIEAQETGVYNLIQQLSVVPLTYSDIIARGKETTFVMQGVTAATDSNAKATEFWTNVSEQGAKRRTAAEHAAAEQMRRSQERTHEYITNSLIDIADNGGSAFERMGDAFVATVKRMVAEWAASKLMNLVGMGSPASSNPFAGFGGGGGGGSTAASVGSSVATSAIGKAVSSIFGGGTAAGTAATSGAGAALATAGTAIKTGTAAVAGAAKTAGSTVMAVAAANPVLAAIAVAAMAAAALSTKSTPSTNAGLLIHDAPGVAADRKFAVSPFASGFAPVGFARREDQGAAQQVIEAFRAVDAQLTNAALSAGLNVDFSHNPFGGFDEKGQGNGLFLGAASEKGKGTTSSPIDQQLLMFSRQFVEALGSQVSSNDRANLLASSSVEELVAKANQIAGIDGSHKMGLSRVPFDGYRAELHAGERVLTAPQARSQDAMTSEMQGMMMQMREMVRYAKKTSDLLTRVTRDGDSLVTVTA